MALYGNVVIKKAGFATTCNDAVCCRTSIFEFLHQYPALIHSVFCFSVRERGTHIEQTLLLEMFTHDDVYCGWSLSIIFKVFQHLCVRLGWVR